MTTKNTRRMNTIQFPSYENHHENATNAFHCMRCAELEIFNEIFKYSCTSAHVVIHVKFEISMTR